MRELTKRQSEIYDYIIVQTKGYPPRISFKFYLHGHLSRLEEKVISAETLKPRAIEIVSEHNDAAIDMGTIHVPSLVK